MVPSVNTVTNEKHAFEKNKLFRNHLADRMGRGEERHNALNVHSINLENRVKDITNTQLKERTQDNRHFVEPNYLIRQQIDTSLLTRSDTDQTLRISPLLLMFHHDFNPSSSYRHHHAAHFHSSFSW